MAKKSVKGKNTNLLIIIVIILFILLLGLSGFVAYDKFNDYYVRNHGCVGCNDELVPVTHVDPVGEIERKLDIVIPVLNDEIDDYTVFNEGWPYGAHISFNREASIEIAKEFSELSVSKIEFLSVGKDTIKSLDVSIYFDSTELEPTKSAVWMYNDIFYAFTLKETSTLDFDECVETLIDQVLVNG